MSAVLRLPRKAASVLWAVVNLGNKKPWLLAGETKSSTAFWFGVVVPIPKEFCALVSTVDSIKTIGHSMMM
jgi:hypothetical protein